MSERLSIEELNVTIGGKTVLADVSFVARRGEVVGLVGDSGSGKSMTALALTALLPRGSRATGRLKLDGIDVDWDQRAALRGRRIGLVFQEPATALNPLMKIGDQVSEAIRLHSDLRQAQAHRQAEELLARVGLSTPSVPTDRYPHELSGGQRQRVALAIALAARPDILIADEPTTALDVTTQANILRLLAKLTTEDGLSTLLISHDLGVIRDISSRILVMSNGRLVEEGTSESLLKHSAHPATLRLIKNYDPPNSFGSGSHGGLLLEAKGLSKRYRSMGREQFALQDIDLCVRAGERVGVIGESGSGKSTLVRCLLGLEVPERGELKIAGMNVNPTRREQTVEQRQLVQAVFQDPVSSLNPRLPIETIIAEPLRLLPKYPGPDELRDRVNRALTCVGLTGVSLQARPHEFSGGQRQRLAIARALVIEPQLLVLDEAVSALDAATRNEILLLLQELFRSRGLGFLFVTHDLSVVRAITDRLIVLRQGKVVDEGPTARLLTSPEHPYTRELVEATPSLIRRQSLDSGSHDAQ